MGPVTLTLVVSGLVGAGILECDVNVSVLFTDGPKASKFLEGYISLVLLPFLKLALLHHLQKLVRTMEYLLIP